MIGIFLCLLAIIGAIGAIIVGGTVLCLLFFVIGIIGFISLFAYFGFFFLSSATLLAYAGFFIVLFLVARKFASGDSKNAKTLLLLFLGLILLVAISYILSGDVTIYRIGYGFSNYDHSMDFVIIGLILLVGVLAAFFARYNLQIHAEKKVHDPLQPSTKELDDDKH